MTVTVTHTKEVRAKELWNSNLSSVSWRQGSIQGLSRGPFLQAFLESGGVCSMFYWFL